MSSDTKNAAQVAEATEGNWLAAEKRAQELESTVSRMSWLQQYWGFEVHT